MQYKRIVNGWMIRRKNPCNNDVFATLYLIGNGEVDSSILSRSTILLNKIND